MDMPSKKTNNNPAMLFISRLSYFTIQQLSFLYHPSDKRTCRCLERSVMGITLRFSFSLLAVFAVTLNIPATILAGDEVADGKEANIELTPLSVRLVPSEVTLRGATSSQTFLVMATFEGGLERDVTSQADLSLSSSELAELTPMPGARRVLPRADGELSLKATLGDKEDAAIIQIVDSQIERPLSFPRDIGSILTGKGCNSTKCHGAVPGQGGFKLSLHSTHPHEDYKWIIEGGHFEVLTVETGDDHEPRVNLSAPEQSLLLLKATEEESHEGGQRFGTDSPEYAKILRWIREGAPYGPENEAETIRIDKLEVYPKEMTLRPKTEQQILVTAHLSNGQTEDVTDEVIYESNSESVLDVDSEGLVTSLRPGETNILIRAPGHVVTSRVGVVARAILNYPSVPERNFIDRYIFAKLRRLNVIPSEISTDEEFLRRICLDLTGTLPPPNRVREFLVSQDPQKRDKLIEVLFSSPEHVDFLCYRFAEILRLQGGATQLGKDTQRSREWLRKRVTENMPYDQLMIERIASQGYDGPSRFNYLLRSLLSPEAQIAEQLRIGWGRRLDCAQCHDHPFESWTQDQFWGMAAFYGRMVDLRTSVMDNSVILDSPHLAGRVKHPRTGQVVQPTFLDGSVVPESERLDLRMKLARGIVSHPHFAEAFVNRVWDWFFGAGFVNPVDDFRSTNPPRHPELLSALAADFREHGHDVKHLMRVIVRSRTYQLSGKPNETNRGDRQNFSHAVPRPLDPPVLLDAITQVTEVSELFTSKYLSAPPGTRAIALLPDAPSDFLKIFNRNLRKTLPNEKPQPTLAKSLHSLTGRAYTEKIINEDSRVRRLLDSGLSDEEIVDELYLATLSRFPTSGERTRLTQMIGERDRQKGIQSLAWALISSRQFDHIH